VDERSALIETNLAALRDRIAAACRAAGRDPAEVTLVAVTKTYPAADVVRLASLGIVDIGENRDQEAAPKAAEVAGSTDRVRWHFVGHLQRNKCRSVVRYADFVHSVDSPQLAGTLGEQAARYREDRPVEVFAQVSIDGDTSRGGAPAGDALDRVTEAVASRPALRLCGVMAVAPLDWDPAAAFAHLASVAERVRKAYPTAVHISAGMSDDLEQAVAYGSTFVRVGSALLGNRPALR
jgi:pyridoxal phosphate enzyme (YggS family)